MSCQVKSIRVTIGHCPSVQCSYITQSLMLTDPKVGGRKALSRQWICCDPGFCRFYQDVALGLVPQSLQRGIVKHLAQRKIGHGLFSVDVPNAASQKRTFRRAHTSRLGNGSGREFLRPSTTSSPHLYLCLAALALLRYITSNVDSSMTRAVPVLSF